MYRYNVTVTRIVDGDTVDVDIDLGFGMVYKKQRVQNLEQKTWKKSSMASKQSIS
jgi:hypothetical protein